MTMFHRALVAAIAIALLPASAAAEKIKEIVVAENTKTTTDTVLYIAGIEEGDDWDDDVQNKVRQDLVSSGLFKEVELFSEPHPKGGGVKVTIIVKDKHSWVIAPTFYNQPTNTGGGLGFGENNLFGENKKILVYGQVATGESFFVGAYIDPSIGGTPFSWQVDTVLKYERVIEYGMPTRFIINEDHPTDPVRQSKMMYLNTGIKFGVTILRRLKLEQRLRGAKVAFYGTRLRNEDGEEGATPDDVCGVGVDCVSGAKDLPPEPGKEGWDVSTESVLTFDRRANWYGITTGSRIRLAYETALPALGSDYDYWYTTFSFERARRYFSRHNLIWRGMVGYGKDLPFQQEYTSGGTSMRGYEGRQFRGDFKVGTNLEYSFPLIGLLGSSLRGAFFWDSAYVAFLDIEKSDAEFRHYLPNSDVRDERVSNVAPWKNSVGAGIRLYVRQIVLPLLGLDFGYGLESGGVEVYFAIGLTDV
jgi:outer membrane protein assembly factor BamA